MSDIYPKVETTVEIKKLDKNVVANACIIQMQAELTKAQAIGPVLNSSDDVATFNEVWDAIVAEGKLMRGVSLTKTIIVKEATEETAAVTEVKDRTEAEYKEALADCCVYLDSTKWYAGLLKEKDVKNYTELKALYKGE